MPLIVISACAVFMRVSVVRMAVAKASAAAGVLSSLATAAGRAAMSLSTGRGTPMMPVEDGKISCGSQPRRKAKVSQLVRALWRPSGPVAQLALPAFTITARMLPPVLCMCSRPTMTGAATT